MNLQQSAYFADSRFHHAGDDVSPGGVTGMVGNYSTSGAWHWSGDGRMNKLHLTSATRLYNHAGNGCKAAPTGRGPVGRQGTVS